MTRAAVIRRIGTTVLRGKYRLDRVLGEGGMAVVYAATHLQFGKLFAVKMLHSELLSDEQIRARFVREGRVASLLHRGAVEIFDCETDTDGSLLLVMELLDGTSVDTLGPGRGCLIPLNAALHVTCLLLEVLQAAHEKGIVHRDIKPANLFLLRDGQLKVLDFGISRLRDGALTPGTTTIGGPMGTPAFMAPEQARGDAAAIDARTDLFGVGATLFTLISGEHVHSGVDARQVMFRAASEPVRSLASVAPGTPPEIVEVVAKAVAFEKSERWESAAAMRAAILAFYEAHFGAPQLSSLAALVAAHPSPLPKIEAPPGFGGASTVPEPNRDAKGQAPPLASPLGIDHARRSTRFGAESSGSGTPGNAASLGKVKARVWSPFVSKQRVALALGAALLVLAVTLLQWRNHARDATSRALPPTVPIHHAEESVSRFVQASVAPAADLMPRLSEPHAAPAEPRRSVAVRPPRVRAPALGRGGLDPPPLPPRD